MLWSVCFYMMCIDVNVLKHKMDEIVCDILLNCIFIYVCIQQFIEIYSIGHSPFTNCLASGHLFSVCFKKYYIGYIYGFWIWCLYQPARGIILRVDALLNTKKYISYTLYHIPTLNFNVM